MDTIFSGESKYFSEYGKVTYPTWNRVAKLKRTWDMMITLSSVLWIVFFLTLTALVNLFGG